MKSDTNDVSYKLVAIGGSKGQTVSQVAAVIKSFENFGVFRHLSKGCGSQVHRLIIVDAVRALADLEAHEVAEYIGKSHFGAGNTSAWSKWLEANLQWQIVDDDGKPEVGENGNPLPYLTFKQRFGDSDISTVELDRII